MAVVAPLRETTSILPATQTTQAAVQEAKVIPQIQKWNLRLGLLPRHSSVQLGILMILIFLPRMYCHLELTYYSFYEIVIPKRLTAQGKENPVEKATYMLLTQGQKHLVHLKVKRDYFVNNFPVYSYHDGILRQETSFRSRDCHYEGYIEGVPGSFVSINTCSGLKGVLVKGEASYGIEPVLSSNSFEHVLYTMGHHTGASCSVSSQDGHGNASPQDRSRKPVSLWAQSYLWSHTKYVEMFVVVNHQRFQMWGSNISETVGAVMDIIALANSFTRGLDTEVVLAGMEIWTEGDLVEVPVDLKVTLWNFNRWRQEKLSHRVRHDVAHMIVGHDPGENTGQAYLNGACSSAFAAAVEAFHREDVLLFAALMVHQLGHNLGIQHDHGGCVCKEEHFCLMQENITTGRGFSNCSSDYFYHFLHEHRGDCLFNKPSPQSRKRRDAVCGNGVVEDWEECDCGSDCDSHPCCEPTCKLKENAVCGDGLCCYKCNFKKKGVLCRPAVDECDLPEFCDGMSEQCPADSYKQDGTLCDRIYYCSGGQCRNPDRQCSNIYGYPARSAPEDCYLSVNTKGNRFGNCGQVTGANPAYVTCEDDNVFCGKLVCTGISYLPPIKRQHTLIQIPYGDDWCWSMDGYNMTDIPDSGDMRSGTYCAPNKVCMGYTCTNHTVLHYDCEPQQMCHGKGVCNNLRHCHCDEGFAPPDCKAPGNGGSVDSGPPGKPSDKNLEAFPSNTRRKPRSDEDEDELNMKVVLLVVPVFLVVLLCGLLIIAYVWSELKSAVESESSSESSATTVELPSEESVVQP